MRARHGLRLRKNLNSRLRHAVRDYYNDPANSPGYNYATPLRTEQGSVDSDGDGIGDGGGSTCTVRAGANRDVDDAVDSGFILSN